MSSEISLSTQDFSGVASGWGPVTGISTPLASRVGAEFGSTVPSGFPLSGPTGATTRERNIVISSFNDIPCAVINIGFVCPDRIRWHGAAQHTHTYAALSHIYSTHTHTDTAAAALHLLVERRACERGSCKGILQCPLSINNKKQRLKKREAERKVVKI
jgi:hypothetical protein